MNGISPNPTFTNTLPANRIDHASPKPSLPPIENSVDEEIHEDEQSNNPSIHHQNEKEINHMNEIEKNLTEFSS